MNVKGKDVAHKNGNPKDNRTINLTVKSASKNRSFRSQGIGSDSKKKNPMAGKLKAKTMLKRLPRKNLKVKAVNKAGNYTKPEMRKRLFNRIKAGGKVVLRVNGVLEKLKC